MMPRSVSPDRQRSAGILSRRSSPNSTSCPDPTSAAIRKHLPPAPLVNCGPSGTRSVTRPLDRTGAVRHHWSQTDHHIVCWSRRVSGGQVVSPAPASGRAGRLRRSILLVATPLGSVITVCTDNTCPRVAVLRLRARHDVTQIRNRAHSALCTVGSRSRRSAPRLRRAASLSLFGGNRSVSLLGRAHAMTLLTTSRAAPWTSARCSGPRNDSA
jgi:hypothetical protein